MACGKDMTIRPDSDLVFETGVRRPNRLTLALRTALAMESTIHYQNSLRGNRASLLPRESPPELEETDILLWKIQ